MKTADEVLKMAETTLSELAIAGHESNYTKLVAQIDDGDIIDAFVTEDINEYDQRGDGWTLIFCTGTGSTPCNCDACQAGDDPADWAGDDGDALAAIDDEIQRKIDEVLT